MKVLLLAAGRGTRISRYLAGNPKCTVDIGGQKLIQYTIELFHGDGVHGADAVQNGVQAEAGAVGVFLLDRKSVV